jgi:hypothetical protein
MGKPSRTSNNVIRRSASDIPKPTPDDLARLKTAMDHPIDTSEIPEIKKLGPRVQRDSSGNLQKNPLGVIRQAILSALGRSQMTRYELWKRAHAVQPTLSQSGVYEYLRGQRDIGVTNAEALMAAAGVMVDIRKPSASPRS